jgi:hypothetical protein
VAPVQLRLTAWPPPARWLEGVARTLIAFVRRVARNPRIEAESSGVYMSRDWLAEFERRYAKHRNDI